MTAARRTRQSGCGVECVGDEGAGLTLWDKKGAPRAVLGAAQSNLPRTGVITKFPESSLMLLDEDGKTVLWRAP